MKLLSLLAVLLFVSCGSKKSESSGENSLEPLTVNTVQKSFLIECNSIQSKLLIDNECGKLGMTNQKMYILNFDNESNSNPYYSSENGYIKLDISLDNEVIEARFVLVSKNGKIISNEASYSRNDKSIFFNEISEGDFIHHEVYLKTVSLLLKTGEQIQYENEEDKGCVTGRISFSEYEHLVQPEGCQGLKTQRVFSGARVSKPEFFESIEEGIVKRYAMRGMLSRPKDGNSFGIITIPSRYKVKIFDQFSFVVVDFNSIYKVNELGNLEVIKNRECYQTGILKYTDFSLRDGKWFDVVDSDVKLAARGTVTVQGRELDAVADYKKNECFELNPEPVGYMLIKE